MLCVGNGGHFCTPVLMNMSSITYYNRPGDILVLGQRSRRLTGIEPAMYCDAGPTLNRNLVGRIHRLYQVHRRQVLNECWLAPAGALG